MPAFERRACWKLKAACSQQPVPDRAVACWPICARKAGRHKKSPPQVDVGDGGGERWGEGSKARVFRTKRRTFSPSDHTEGAITDPTVSGVISRVDQSRSEHAVAPTGGILGWGEVGGGEQSPCLPHSRRTFSPSDHTEGIMTDPTVSGVISRVDQSRSEHAVAATVGRWGERECRTGRSSCEQEVGSEHAI